jgi:hypothetical protein
MTSAGTSDSHAFDRATAVAGGGEGMITGAIHDGWDIGGNANGGYLLALAANGLRRIAGRPDPVTITAHYLAPGTPGDVSIVGEVVKSGKRFTTVSGAMHGGGKRIIQVLGTFGELGGEAPRGLAIVHGAPPSLPPLDLCTPRAANGLVPTPLMDQLDVRLHPEHARYLAGEPRLGIGEMAGWFAFADGRPIDTLALLLIADAFPPAVFNLDIPPGWVPTVELTVHVRATPAPGPVSCVFRSRFVHSGMMEEDGEVWDANGTLVALSRQLALLPR